MISLQYPSGFQQPGFQPHYSQIPSRAATPSTNTTLPKPPIFDKEGQPWLEACSASGKVYYFNARTRETRWDRPESFEEAEAKKLAGKEEEVRMYAMVYYVNWFPQNIF